MDTPVLAVTLLVGLVTIWFIQKSFLGERNFSKYRDQVAVISSSLHPATEKGELPRVVGIVTNQSDHPWSNPSFEVRFYAAQGELVEVVESGEFFTLPAHGDHSFNLILFHSVLRSNYVTHKVVVRGAKEPSYFW